VGVCDFAMALKHTQTGFNASLEHYLPLQYLTGELMGSDFLRQKRSFGANLNFIPFTEQTTYWQDIQKQATIDLTHVAPWYQTVLFVWLLRDGIGLSLNVNAQEGQAASEKLLDNFITRLNALSSLVIS
jgi:hypothetical protein